MTPNTGEIDPNKLPEDAKALVRDLSGAIAAATGGIAGDSAASAQLGGVVGVNAVENNYLSKAQQIQKAEELAECEGVLCRAKLEAKWGAISVAQDSSFSAGVAAGIPVGIYDAAKGITDMLISPVETYEALKSLFYSGDVLGNVSEAVKQSYIDRIDRMKIEYEKAGFSGSFNAGVEQGKLIIDIAGLFAGGVGAAKVSAGAVEKIVTKVASKAKAASKVDKGVTNVTSKVNKGVSNVKDDFIVLSSDIEKKVLEGQRVVNSNRIIGGHSASINNQNPRYAYVQYF